MAYCVLRFRHRPGNTAAYEPENRRLEGWLATGTTFGVAAMLAPGLFVWNQFVTVPQDASEVEVIGQQWLWSFRLPGADGKLGTTETRDIAPENSLGVNRDDAAGQDDIIIEGGELHLPVGKPVKMLLRSVDVLHDFYVPEFRAKMDMCSNQISVNRSRPSSNLRRAFNKPSCNGSKRPRRRGAIFFAEDRMMTLRLPTTIAASLLALFATVGSAQAETTVKFWHSFKADGEALEKIIANFEAANPDIDIQAELIGNYNDIVTKLQAAIPARRAPDAVIMRCPRISKGGRRRSPGACTIARLFRRAKVASPDRSDG